MTVVANDTSEQDFNLPAGWLSYSPPDLEVTLDLGASTSLPFLLFNSGGLAATFELQEKDKGFHILQLATGPFANPKPLVPPNIKKQRAQRG